MERITRRDFTKKGLIAGAALALPGAIRAQDKPAEPKPDPEIDEKAKKIEAQLAKPLDEKAKGLLNTSVNDAQGTVEARMKHKLPENSEPCFLYVVTVPKGGRK